MKIQAQYNNQNLPPNYLGNPLIEALTPILSPDEAMAALTIRPNLEIESLRQLPLHIRAHGASSLQGLFVPRREAVDLESEISLLLRSGYLRRNPVHAAVQRELWSVRERMREERLQQFREMQGGEESPLPPCILVTGLSGSGKSRTLRTILSLTPQVIVHEAYGDLSLRANQITWLSVDAPINGSMQGFLLRLFAAFDRALGLTGPAGYVTQIGRLKTSVDHKIEQIAQLASTYHLGLLHIDDLQRLVEVHRSKAALVLNVVIQLANVVKVPLVLSGTPKTAQLLGGSLEAARRTTSSGAEYLSLPGSADDSHFNLLIKALSRYQWLDQPVQLDARWSAKLFDYSRGLPAVLIGLFMNSQKHAARLGAKSLTFDHLEHTYQRSCELLQPALDALRSSNPKRFELFEDLLPTNLQIVEMLRKNEEALLLSHRGVLH